MEKIASIPSLFSATGAFEPLSDDVLCQQSNIFNSLYQKVSDCYTASEIVERKTERTTKRLHAVVAELRDAEGKLAKFGRKSAVANVKDWIESQRRFG